MSQGQLKVMRRSNVYVGQKIKQKTKLRTWQELPIWFEKKTYFNNSIKWTLWQEL